MIICYLNSLYTNIYVMFSDLQAQAKLSAATTVRLVSYILHGFHFMMLKLVSDNSIATGCTQPKGQ
jgi:hypothetical protein